MIEAIEKQGEIEKANTFFQNILKKILPERKGEYVIGFKGGNTVINNLRANERIWHIHRVIKDDKSISRHWNAFGLSNHLKINGSNPIVVEINIALKGAPKRVGGLLARDKLKNSLFLLHRGKIGGGRKGIGKNTFLEWYKEDSIQVNFSSSKKPDNAILVSDLKSSEFTDQIANFVEAVALFKSKSYT